MHAATGGRGSCQSAQMSQPVLRAPEYTLRSTPHVSRSILTDVKSIATILLLANAIEHR